MLGRQLRVFGIALSLMLQASLGNPAQDTDLLQDKLYDCEVTSILPCSRSASRVPKLFWLWGIRIASMFQVRGVSILQSVGCFQRSATRFAIKSRQSNRGRIVGSRFRSKVSRSWTFQPVLLSDLVDPRLTESLAEHV